MADAAVAEIAGWTPSVHELVTSAMGTDSAMTETMVFYSNTDYEIEVPFESKYPFDYDYDADGTYESWLVYAPDYENIGGGSLPTTMNPGDEVPNRTLDGALGTYICADAGGCTIATDASGISSITGYLIFTPEEEETVVAPDPDYLFFGYWIRESTDGDGDPVFDIAGLYGGAELSYMYYVHMLEGSATYAGPATGVFVRRWTDSDSGEVLRRRTGQFTADVALSANFGGGDIAPNDQFMISGTVSDFEDAERGVNLGWQLALESAYFGPGLTTPWFLGDTEGGGDTTALWWGQFFGPVTPNNLLTPENETVYPSGVAGGFEGDFPNGDVVGAYAAERDE